MMERGIKAGAPFSYDALNRYLFSGNLFGIFSLNPQFHEEDNWLFYSDRELRPDIHFNSNVEEMKYHIYNFVHSVNPRLFHD